MEPRPRLRTVRDAEDAHDLLERWKCSGELMGAGCERHGVTRHSLQWWRRSGSSVLRVAEVVLSSPVPTTEYRLILTNGRELVVGASFDADAVRRLVEAVDG